MSDIDRVLRSNLKLKHLQLVVALDEFRHLGRAAEFLALTQPAVSKSLAEVERLFGHALFHRSTRGTVPTAQGSSVARFARLVLAEHDRTRDELTALARGGTGRVRVGAMVVAVPGLLFGAIGALKAVSPRTVVSVEEGDLTRLLPRLRVGELDLIVGRLEPGYAAPDLLAEPLFEEAMCVVAAPDHPLQRRRQPGWPDAAGEPWVVPPAWASSRVKLEQQFFRHGLQPPTNLIETASFLVTLAALRQQRALGFVAEGVAVHLEAEGLARRLALPVQLELPPVGLITLRRTPAAPAVAQLQALLREGAAARVAPAQLRSKSTRGRAAVPGSTSRSSAARGTRR